MQKILLRILFSVVAAYGLAGLIVGIYTLIQVPHDGLFTQNIVDVLFWIPWMVLFGPTYFAIQYPFAAVGWIVIVSAFLWCMPWSKKSAL